MEDDPFSDPFGDDQEVILEGKLSTSGASSPSGNATRAAAPQPPRQPPKKALPPAAGTTFAPAPLPPRVSTVSPSIATLQLGVASANKFDAPPRSATLFSPVVMSPKPSPPQALVESWISSPPLDQRSSQNQAPPPLPPRPTSPIVRQARQSEPLIPPPVPARPFLPTSQSSSEKLSDRSLDRPFMSLDRAIPSARSDDQKVKSFSPDFTTCLNRKPPDPRNYLANQEISHKGSVKCMATSGFYVCTAGQQNLRLYHLTTGENVRSLPLNELKITAVVFVPCRHIEDEGKTIWFSVDKGDIMEADVQSGSSITITDKKNAHSATVTHLLRYRGGIWSLDENGGLKIWNPEDGVLSLSGRPRSLRIGSRQERVVIVRGRLWSAAGRAIEMYYPDNATTLFQQRTELTGIAGNVTSFTASYDEGLVFSGHDDGKIIMWNSENLSKLAIVSCSVYKITSLLCLSKGHLWVGFSTGKVHVYDTVPSQWVALKEFSAHSSTPVTEITMDEKSLLISGQMTVSTFTAELGQIRVWDGFLADDWTESYLKGRETDFCSYRSIGVFVGSWNIDANKPDVLDSRPRDEQTIMDWFLTDCNPPPALIVIGFQELVDLESKKANAKQIFFEATKHTSSKNHVDSRLAAWQDRLTRTLRDCSTVPYRLAQCHQLFGLFQCVFVLESETANLRMVEAAQIKTGFGGFHGNKEPIGARLILDDTSFCFVNCHLAAHQTQVSARNNDAAAVRDGLTFSTLNMSPGVFEPGGNGSSVLDYENVVMSGDLNYRIDLPRDKVLDAIDKQNWKLLLDNDQLGKQRQSNTYFGFRGYSEGPINFAPTFKYDILSKSYDSSEKKRVPAYCDRILWRGKWVQKSYRRSECTVSDHRPVSATFDIPVKRVIPDLRERCRKSAEEVRRQECDDVVRSAKIGWLVANCGADSGTAEKLLKMADWNLKSARQSLEGK
ncbi:Endonuclease/exonuclease/phosphatase [Zopfochytrium polystomum]|nr:Endonuclease/exonuclease/phosphatase [Zopfochytrium polystomum]